MTDVNTVNLEKQDVNVTFEDMQAVKEVSTNLLKLAADNMATLYEAGVIMDMAAVVKICGGLLLSLYNSGILAGESDTADNHFSDMMISLTGLQLELEGTDEVADDSQQQQKVCCICGEPLDGIGGMGNNPWPIDTRPGEECCSLCNSALVIPARLTLRKMQRDYLNGPDPKETLESLNLDDDTDDDGDGSDKAEDKKSCPRKEIRTTTETEATKPTQANNAADFGHDRRQARGRSAATATVNTY